MASFKKIVQSAAAGPLGVLADQATQSVNANPWVVAAAKYGPLADADAKRNGFKNGQEEILKIIRGESNFNPNAVSSAGAKGAGQFMPATRAEFLHRYGVDAWSSNPDIATKAVALFLKDRGIKAYNPGMSTYISYIQGQDISKLGDLQGGAGLVSGALGAVNPLEALDAAKEVAKFMLDHLTHPEKMAALIARVWVTVLRFFFRAYWEYVLQPIVSWYQRAVAYYWDEIMSFKPGESRYYYTYAGIITTAFWSLGFSVLFMRVEPDAGMAANPRDTILGRGIKAAQIGVARQSLTKPKDVQKKTPKKPDGEEATVELERTREVQVKRRRPVQVTGAGATDATDATGPTEGATTTTGDSDVSSTGRRGTADKRRVGGA
jgi:hypothetical protein